MSLVADWPRALGVVAVLLSACATHGSSGVALAVRSGFADLRQATPEVKAQYAAVILAQKDAIGACVWKYKAEGKLVLIWDIQPSGEVANIGVRDRDFAAHPVSRCIADVVATLQFPPSADGVTAFNFPFKFQSP
ncbi:MAG: AgmX/PglI C-terminal domain-containing protein [Archangium sp.]|nr:AgmX/PglI C-terminal domain-containing protein [Archangium sp.]